MSAAQSLPAEAFELARAFDSALADLLTAEVLLKAAAQDRPLGPALDAELLALGWVAIAVPEELGGLGLDATGCAVLAAAAGRRLLPTPMRGEAFILAPLLGEGAPDARLDDLLEGGLRGGGVGSGEATAETDRIELIAFLPPNARLLGIIGTDAAFVVDLHDSNVDVTPIKSLEPGQGASRVRVQRLQSSAVALDPGTISTIVRRWRLGALAEAFGVGKEALERAVAYATQRQQFGRPIASFQAVAHLLATAAVSLEAANAGIGRLATQMTDGANELDFVLAHMVPAASRSACEVSIQVHGGMGFTWELGLHLHYRRALSLQTLLGGAQDSLREAGTQYLAARQATVR